MRPCRCRQQRGAARLGRSCQRRTRAERTSGEPRSSLLPRLRVVVVLGGFGWTALWPVLAVVTFFAGFIPIVGAFVAGALAVIVALTNFIVDIIAAILDPRVRY